MMKQFQLYNRPRNDALITTAIFALMLLAGVSAAFAAPVTVNLSGEKQAIRGFGGMNHPVWISDLTAAQRDVAFGNGSGQLGFTVLRIHVNENSSLWQREVATAKRAIEHGAIVFASPWNPPSDMAETYSGVRKRLKYNRYADYAKHLNDFVSFMKTNGAELEAISIQNEPDYDDEWLWWTGAEMVNFLKNNAASINCRIIAPESFQYVKSMSDPILNDAQALANVDIIGAHLYGTQVSQFPYPLFKQKGAGKELWMTEVYHPNSSSDADTWPEAIDVAVHVHRAMAEAEFQMYVWWYIRRSYGPMKEDGTISKRGYMMAHFSKFVRPGYIRVDATKDPETDVFVSAYKGDGKVVVVAINKKTSDVNQSFTLSDKLVTKMEGYRTTASANLAKTADASVVNGAFTATLPARSVTTFVGSFDNGSGSTNASVSCNVNNLDDSYVSGSSVPRPNVSCGEGIAAGTASFSINGTEVTGWSNLGGTHRLYNDGTRTVLLNSLECGGTNIALDPPISCGDIEITPDQSTSVVSGSALARAASLSVKAHGSSLIVKTGAPAVVEIYNIMGVKKADLKISGASQSVELSLPAGVYFAKTRGAGDVRGVRFVIR